MVFCKYQALGNDFLIIDGISGELAGHNLGGGAIRFLCDRNFGIGADGFIIAKKTNGRFLMVLNNSDGTRAEMSGNGIRCLAKFLIDKAYVSLGQVEITTDAGVKYLRTYKDNGVFYADVDMGKPAFDNEMIPAAPGAAEKVLQYLANDIAADRVTLVSMGNPHCVVFVDDLNIDLQKYGSHIENMDVFPQRTNVEFAKVKSEKEIDVIVWERGVGITLACGTGSSAVVAAAKTGHKTEDEVKVNLPGGSLFIKYEQGGSVHMAGEAKYVFEGKIDLADERYGGEVAAS